jgi:tetratricopeptide (TPR) repeat protein
MVTIERLSPSTGPDFSELRGFPGIEPSYIILLYYNIISATSQRRGRSFDADQGPYPKDVMPFAACGTYLASKDFMESPLETESRRRLLFMPMYLLLSLAGFDSITKAQTIDYQWCFNPPPAGRITSSAIDNRIGGCTEIIENGRATREYLVKAFRSRGTAYILYKGKSSSEYYYRGIQDYDQAIRLDPNNSNDFNTRGLGYAATEQFEQAIQDYSEAIRLDPKNTNSLNNRGLIYTHTGQFDRAIQDYNEAIRLDPNLASTYYNRGITNELKGMSLTGIPI